MLPSSVLSFSFPRTSRDRGNAYVRPGLVTIVRGDRDEVVATVQGTDRYDVRLRREVHDDETSFVVFCSCGYVDLRAEPCKHIWAALVVAERSGYLRDEQDPPLRRETTFLGIESPWRGRTPGESRVRPRVSAPRPPAANAFLANVARELEQRDATGAEPARYQDVAFLYVIDGYLSRDTPHVVVHVMGQERSRQGGVNKPKTLRLSLRDVSLAPAADRRILALLWGAPARDPNTSWNDERERTSTFELPGALAVELLPLIARTARAWFRTGPDAQVLEPVTWDDGNAWRFDFKIESMPQGYRVTGALVRDEVNVPVTERFQVLAGSLVVVRRKIARLNLDASAPFLRALGQSGPIEITAADAPALAEAVAESGVPLDNLPDAMRVEEIRVTPRPRVRIEQRPDRTQGWLTAELSFDYGGIVVFAGARRTSIFHKPSKRVIHRDRTAEAAAERRLMDLGFRSEWYPTGNEIEIAVHQMSPAVRSLVGEGWLVEADGVRHRMPAPIDLEVTSGIDWFDLSATVSFDGESFSLTEILAALKPGEQTIRLGDGSIGLLPEDWAERYGGLTATGEIDGNHIRFRRSQAAILDAILATREADSRIRVDALFEQARREIGSFASIEAEEAPPSFTGVLRGYQKDGLGWFSFLRRFQFGGCLADDMGLGKTIMVLALLDARRQHAEASGDPRLPSLVVVPRSLVGNWLAEAKNFTPNLRLLDHSHGERTSSATSFESADAVLVTYGTLRRDIAALSSAEFDYVILDEAQTIKNATTASAKAARLVRARHRLALSGTPIENHLGELWSLFEFLNPGILGRSTAFKRLSSSEQADDATTALIARGLRPFILRRTKRQVARELPERTENTIFCELLPKDRRLYDGLRHHYRTTLLDRIDQHGLGKSKIHVLEALLRLRQVACHAGLVDPTRASDDSAKFDVLLPQLEEVVAEGHKAIVFSQFTTLLGLLRQRLDRAKIPYEYLDGKTRDRAAHVERFQTDPAVPLFLVSLKAGGLGLNLTAAEYVFLLDPWWNPAAEAQAIDRAHRIGQTREVFAYRLIAKDTVEEKVLALQQSKRDLADAVLSANAVGLRDLSRDDLELLLS